MKNLFVNFYEFLIQLGELRAKAYEQHKYLTYY